MACLPNVVSRSSRLCLTVTLKSSMDKPVQTMSRVSRNSKLQHSNSRLDFFQFCDNHGELRHYVYKLQIQYWVTTDGRGRAAQACCASVDLLSAVLRTVISITISSWRWGCVVKALLPQDQKLHIKQSRHELPECLTGIAQDCRFGLLI